MVSFACSPTRRAAARPVQEASVPVAEQVYRRLRDDIAAGRLAPRARLSERALSAALGVSTSPIKAALKRLEQEGMVVTQPRRGTWVAFAPEKAHEMGLIRAALEGIAARLAAQRIGAADLAALEAILAELRRATESLDREALVEANDRYHALVLKAADNVFLANAVRGLRGYFLITQARMRTMRLRPELAMAEHEAIFAALAAHDAEAAERAMRAHIARTVETLWGPGAAPAARLRRVRRRRNAPAARG
ncbi:GntR family transcriptional regulator [Elioraea sp.]|uniref:GntR family transcriptional regulator n=1 Tax=Elioraea sp. TaxID=2185103 RepID=UPI0026186127|nr:GntR family transcriptional regulator [Elioraea sp.]